MDFRWKNYQQNEQPINNGGVIAPVTGSDFEQQRMNDRAELARLKNELAQVDAEIAQFDRENPGIGSGMVDVAAKRAEAGDMGAYDSIVSRELDRVQGIGATRNAATEAVYNHVNEARKLASALDDKSTEFRAEKMDNIRVSLDEAKRKAEKAGVELPREWYELDRKYNETMGELNRGGMRAEALDNALYTKLTNGTLTDNDINGMKWYISQYPNDDRSTEYRSIIDKYKGKTNEKKKEWNDKKRIANEAYDRWNKNRSQGEKMNEWNELKRQKHPITIFFDINEFGNPVPKKG